MAPAFARGPHRLEVSSISWWTPRWENRTRILNSEGIYCFLISFGWIGGGGGRFTTPPLILLRSSAVRCTVSVSFFRDSVWGLLESRC